MVDLEILEARGCSAEKLRTKLTLPDRITDYDNPKLERLRGLIRSRINEVQQNNITNYRIFQAIDTAWDCTANQISPTMIRSIIDSDMTDEGKLDALKVWGVNAAEVLEEYPDPKTPGKTLKRVNMPAFARIYANLLKPYLTIRRSKIMNDRKLVPFMKFEPAISDQESRMRCDVITSRVEQMAQQYGFWSVEDQKCFRMLLYGICLTFPCEEWHKEQQLVENDSPYIGDDDSTDEAAKEGEPAPTKEYKTVTMKEGLRFHMPHPTRMGYDMAWPTESLNTDSGARWALYWRVQTYGEIASKKSFWNLGSISIANTAQWFNNNKAFFDAVYPCSLSFPSPTSANDGVGPLDTEKKIAEGFYVTSDYDKGIVVTEKFMKLVPSEFDLGDYDYPVWFRFVIANHDTIIYCTPLPYTSPVTFDGYDPVSGRTLYPSMALEIIPYQDQFTNLLSQFLYSVKQNLANMTMVDTDIVNEEDIGFLRKCGQLLWTGFNIIRFSSRKFFKAGLTPQAVFPQKLPQIDTNSIAIAMRTVLEILERVLVMSSQEIGQAASHEQTREEVKNIANNTSTRAEFTASMLDRSRYAWKRTAYEGLMAYGSEEGYAQVPADPKITPEFLSGLGFTFEGGDQKKIKVRYNKTAIRYEDFTANRDGDDRINDVELGRAMGNFMMQLLGNPMTMQAVGSEQAIMMANFIAKAAGFPRDFKLHDVTQDQNGQILQQVQQLLQQALEALKGDMEKEIQGVVKELVGENDKQNSAIQQVVSQLVALTHALHGEGGIAPLAPPPNAVPFEQPQQMQAPMAPPNLPAQPAISPMAGAM